jgi:hypothetical protein
LLASGDGASDGFAPGLRQLDFVPAIGGGLADGDEAVPFQNSRRADGDAANFSRRKNSTSRIACDSRFASISCAGVILDIAPARACAVAEISSILSQSWFHSDQFFGGNLEPPNLGTPI